MTQVNMDLVKKLRAKTAVGLMDCRKALIEADGDIDKAIDILRKKGAAVAAKRADQETNEGVIAAHISDDCHVGSLVEIACETDFSANTGDMQTFVKTAAQSVTEAQDGISIDDLLSSKAAGSSLNVQEKLDELISKISESIRIVNIVRYETSADGFVGSYIHPGAHLGVLIMLNADKDTAAHTDALKKLSKDICMQIAVTNPLALDPSQLDPAVVEKEKAFLKEQLIAQNKPAEMIDKILMGQMGKFYQDVCLLNQKFIKDDKKTITQYLEEFSKANGITITVSQFTRFAIGK